MLPAWHLGRTVDDLLQPLLLQLSRFHARDLGRPGPDPGVRVHLPDVLLQLDAGVGAVRALGEVGPGHVDEQALGRVHLDVGAVQALLALGCAGPEHAPDKGVLHAEQN